MTENDQRRLNVADSSNPSAALEAALFEIKRVIVGQEGMLERVLVLLSGGHLLEGARAGQDPHHRHPGPGPGGSPAYPVHPDLVPSDLVGTGSGGPTRAGSRPNWARCSATSVSR